MHRRLLLLPAALLLLTSALAVSPAAGAAHAAAPPTPGAPAPDVHVAVSDFLFDPTTVATEPGTTVVFDFFGPSHHTATDASGMNLYDSGSVGVGEPSFAFTFPAAGGYRFLCIPHLGMGGRVVIPMRVDPATGGRRQTFTATWAVTDAAGGFVYDVQIRRPGRHWARWRVGVTVSHASFVAEAGTGTYRFRARMRSLTGGHALWSAASAIHVG